MSNRVLVVAAAAFMAASSAGFASAAMAAPRHASPQSACTSAGYQPGEVGFSDCVRTLRQETRPDIWSSAQATYADPEDAGRFMALAGRRSGTATPSQNRFSDGSRASEIQACAGLGLGSAALRQCVGNLDAAKWQEEISGQG
jgi:hypothetical protein